MSPYFFPGVEYFKKKRFIKNQKEKYKDSIMQLVAGQFEISFDKIKNIYKKQPRTERFVRHLCFFIFRDMKKISEFEVAKYFDCDRRTVKYGHNKMKKELAGFKNTELTQKFLQIKNSIEDHENGC